MNDISEFLTHAPEVTVGPITVQPSATLSVAQENAARFVAERARGGFAWGARWGGQSVLINAAQRGALIAAGAHLVTDARWEAQLFLVPLPSGKADIERFPCSVVGYGTVALRGITGAKVLAELNARGVFPEQEQMERTVLSFYEERLGSIVFDSADRYVFPDGEETVNRIVALALRA